MADKNKKSNIILNPNKKYNIITLKNLAHEDRPREKMLNLGPEALNSVELLAIVLNSGSKKEDIMNMVHRILKEYGHNSIINEKNPINLEKELDLPRVKACQIVACFELGRRFFAKEKNISINIRNAKQAFTHLKDMGNLNKENLRGLYLNSRYQLIHSETISVGTIDTSIVHPREVFRPAITQGASAIILAHNHPSGVLEGTAEDILVTKKIKEAGELLGIELLDHLIISRDKYISLI